VLDFFVLIRHARTSTPFPYTTLFRSVENINGQAITLAIKHKGKRDPKSWKGFKFAVPFDYSMHNYLLRYFVAEHGLDPDRDIQRSEEHTSELQSRENLVCRLLLEKKK